MNIFVVIPAYNEGFKIGEVIQSLYDHHYHNIIVVDDGSSDITAQVARRAGAIVLQHIVNRGQGAALRTGTQMAIENDADIIVHFDADGQMQPKDIERLILPVKKQNYDIVLGSRFMGNEYAIPAMRRLLLRGAKMFNKIFLGINLNDPQSGFRVLSRKAASLIDIKQDRMAHCSQILHDIVRKKLSVKEIPVEIHYTDYSLKKGQGAFDAFKIVWDLLYGRLMNR